MSNNMQGVAIRNLRSLVQGATFKNAADRNAAISCVDVLTEALASTGAVKVSRKHVSDVVSKTMRDHTNDLNLAGNRPIGEGGAPRISWYDLRNELVDAVLSALDTHPRATSTVVSHETANVSDKPEGQQPVAWSYEFHEFDAVWKRHVILNRPDGRGNPPSKHHGSAVRNVRPLFTRPAEQAVTEAMVVAATEEYYAASFKNTPSGAMRMALKAAMEAGSHRALSTKEEGDE